MTAPPFQAAPLARDQPRPRPKGVRSDGRPYLTPHERLTLPVAAAPTAVFSLEFPVDWAVAAAGAGGVSLSAVLTLELVQAGREVEALRSLLDRGVGLQVHQQQAAVVLVRPGDLAPSGVDAALGKRNSADLDALAAAGAPGPPVVVHDLTNLVVTHATMPPTGTSAAIVVTVTGPARRLRPMVAVDGRHVLAETAVATVTVACPDRGLTPAVLAWFERLSGRAHTNRGVA